MTHRYIKYIFTITLKNQSSFEKTEEYFVRIVFNGEEKKIIR